MRDLLQTMFYAKNVPNLERIIRIALGLGLVVYAMTDTGLIATIGTLARVAVVGSAITIVVTGFVGWCPMCALAGRKLKKQANND